MKCIFPAVMCLLFLCIACNGDRKRVELLLRTNRYKQVVAERYHNRHPLAQLINPGNHYRGMQAFTIEQATDVQIYGVGEISLELADSEKRYYLENDGFELYLKYGKSTARPVRLWFSADTSEPEGARLIRCRWNMRKNYGYTATLMIPYEEIGKDFRPDEDSLFMNIVVADNDDGLVQKAIVAWRGKTGDAEASAYAGFCAPVKAGRQQSGYAEANRAREHVDTIAGNAWDGVEAHAIQTLLYGFVKDRYDLLAQFRYRFDDSCLHMLVEVLDSRLKTIPENKVKERQLFTDGGWLEDEKGERVWEMHARHSKSAGGTNKNQLSDTVLHLRRGSYTLHYKTDESHASGAWTLAEPHTPFYGIVLYEHVPEKQ